MTDAQIMTYAEYVAAYESLLKVFLSYTQAQVGSEVYASKLADLEGAHPSHAAQYDSQCSTRDWNTLRVIYPQITVLMERKCNTNTSNADNNSH